MNEGLSLPVDQRGLRASRMPSSHGLLRQPSPSPSPARLSSNPATTAGVRSLPADLRVYLALLAAILTGYAYFGRGFAYLGYPPIFIDIPVTLLAIVLIVRRPFGLLRLGNLPYALLIIFISWSFLFCTLPYINEYGYFSIRDSSIYGWAIIAFPIAWAAIRYPIASHGLHWYRWSFMLFPVGSLLLYALVHFASDRIPHWPWGPDPAGIPIVLPKGGDIGVHLAGYVAFAALVGHVAGRSAGWNLGLLAVPVLAGVLLVANRGGFLAFAAGAAIAFVWMRKWNVVPYVLATGIVAVLGIAILAFADVEFVLASGRKISLEGMVTSLASIATAGGEHELYTGTANWRLQWWRKIIDYTIFGDYFLFGKGYGINLASVDGFQTDPVGESLRSPHNSHLTILARSGVPGLLLWAMFNVTLLASLWRGRRFWQRRDPLQAGIRGWLFVWLVAALVNTSFDPFLEGPMGGIWFWSVAGLALGLVARDARHRKSHRYFPVRPRAIGAHR